MELQAIDDGIDLQTRVIASLSREHPYFKTRSEHMGIKVPEELMFTEEQARRLFKMLVEGGLWGKC